MTVEARKHVDLNILSNHSLDVLRDYYGERVDQSTQMLESGIPLGSITTAIHSGRLESGIAILDEIDEIIHERSIRNGIVYKASIRAKDLITSGMHKVMAVLPKVMEQK